MLSLKFNFTRIFTSIAIASIAIFIFLQIFTPVQAATGINRQINFQGKLVNNPAATNVTDTSYTVVFTLYDNATGANTALWTETQTVTTVDGIFRVALGSVTPFPANFNFNWSGLYLGIKVNSDAEMTPRVQMAAVPFAFNAEKVAGLTVQDTSGNASTSGTLQVANGVTVKLPNSGTGLIYADSASTGTLTTLSNSTTQTGNVIGQAITLAGATGSLNQTGLQFNLSGATSGTVLDIQGTGNSWYITRTGALTVASCSGCGGVGSTNYWGLTSGGTTGGLLYNGNQTTDFAIAGTSTSSALFSFSGVLTGNTIASASGNLILMPNNGWGGQLGIGTTTPNQALDVRGSGIFGNQLAYDVTAQPNRSKIIYANELTTNTTNDIFSTAGSLEVNPAGATSRIYYGGLYNVLSTSGNAQNFTGRLVGFQGQVSHKGTGTLTQARGFAGIITNDSTGTIIDAFAGRFGNTNTSTGSYTNAYGIYILSPTNTGGGTYNTNYGLYVQDQSNVGIVGSYNVWSDGFNSKNYFAGSVGIGATPSARLHVAGSWGSNAAAIVDQLNSGDIFAASASGTTKFVITNAGSVGLYGTNPSITNTGSNTLTINSGSTGNLQFFSSSNTLSSAGALTLAGGLTATTINGNTFTTGTGTLTLAAGKTVSFADAFTTSGAFPLTLTSTATTNATIPSGTVTLVDLATSQSLTNKTIGTGGLTFNVASGNPDIITSASNQDFTITPNGTGKVVLGTATNGLTFDPAAGTTYTGTGRPTKTITLSPEYAGAALTASGSATTNGSMTSDASPSANFRTYYGWTSTQASLQDYTVAVRVTLPQDFGAWATTNAMTIDFNTATNNSAQNKMDVLVYNPSASASLPVMSHTGMVSSTGKQWLSILFPDSRFTGTRAWNTPGHSAIIYLKMYAGSPGYVQVGDITLNYLSKF